MHKRITLNTLPVLMTLIGAALSGLSGCGSGADSATSALDALPSRVADAVRRNTPVDNSLVAADNRFAFALFDQLRKKEPDANVFVSPTSISLALQIVYNGAQAETKQAMNTTLQLQGMSLDDLNTRNAALQASLVNPDAGVQLTIANSLWLHPTQNAVKPAFVQLNKDFYGSEVGDLAGAPDNVNAWVNQKTNGKISTILPPDDYSDIVAMIANAVYFKGVWTSKFDPTLTAAAPFTLPDGTQKTVSMMHQSSTYGYFQGDHFQALRLSYGKKRLSMLLFLPDTNTPLATFLDGLTAAQWDDWMTRFQDKEGDIALPRFKSEYKVELKDALSVLGMTIAFDATGRANFESLASNVYIKFVKHKTFVEVNEEGTTAAGATVIGVGTTSAPVRFQMQLNRPFFCAIRDDKTGAILFMGSIVNPS